MIAMAAYVRCDPVRWKRILARIWPERFPDIARQNIEAMKAFVCGGFSVDLGGGLSKHGYLPEIHTDYIFALVGEELG